MFDNDCEQKKSTLEARGQECLMIIPSLGSNTLGTFRTLIAQSPQPTDSRETLARQYHFWTGFFYMVSWLEKKYSLEFQTDTVTVQCFSHCVFLSHSHSQWPLPVFESLVVREQTIAPTNKEPVWSKVFRKQLLQTSRPPQPLLKSLNSSGKPVQKMQKW